MATVPADEEFRHCGQPDVVWGPGSIDGLLDAARRWPQAGMLGPLIRDPDGAVYRRPAICRAWSGGGTHAVVGFVWKANPWTKSYRQEGWNQANDRSAGCRSVSSIAPQGL